MSKQEMSSKFKELIDDFLSSFKANHGNSIDAAYLWSMRDKSKIGPISSYEEQKIFDASIEYLLTLKGISKEYSEFYIRTSVMKLCHELLLGEGDDTAAKLVENLIQRKSTKHRILSEIENIHLDDGEYRLIDSTIKKFGEKDIRFNLKDSEVLKQKELLGKPCIHTEVKAKEDRKAEEISLHNFTLSFDLLRLYHPYFKPFLKGYSPSVFQTAIFHNGIYQAGGILTLNHYDISEFVTVQIGKEFYNELVGRGIKELEKPTSISKVVKDGLYWYGLGLDEEYPSARLLNFVTVLEASLKKKGEKTELKRAISERAALILYDKYDERKEALKELKKIYELRSTVVHTGVLSDEKDYASLAGGYASAVLIKLIKMSKELDGDFNRFIDYIDDIKLGKFNN